MKSRAQPADVLASLTLGTVKKRTMTWGRPAVPIINAAVIQKISIFDLLKSVYELNPISLSTKLSLSSRYMSSVRSLEPNPNCGIGFPVINIEIKIAGTI